jgi:hypothetical protein
MGFVGDVKKVFLDWSGWVNVFSTLRVEIVLERANGFQSTLDMRLKGV